MDNRNVVYMSESYDNDIVDHIQNDFIIIKKCEAIIEKYLNVTSIVFSGYSRFEW